MNTRSSDITAKELNQLKKFEKLMQNLNISAEQIENMKHAVGFNEIKVKNGKYLAWRNYFITPSNDESWDDLVLQDLAIKRDFKLGKGENPQCYSVTKEGFRFLESKLNVKIIFG